MKLTKEIMSEWEIYCGGDFIKRDIIRDDTEKDFEQVDCVGEVNGR